jgi:hypothetical protein
MRFTLRGSRDHHYLEKITDFMIACRREDPLGGMWDAGDLQWWWREDLYGDTENQMFFEDREGKTVGVIVTSKDHRCLDYEILPGLGQEKAAQVIFEWGLKRLRNLADNDSSGISYGLQNDWSVNTGVRGRAFKRYLDDQTWQEYESTFAGAAVR